jgi:hypothetical protein
MTDFYKLGMWEALYTVKLAVDPGAIQNPGLKAQVQSPASGFRQPQGQSAVGAPPPAPPRANSGPTPGTGPGTPGPTGTPNPPSPGGNPTSSPAAGIGKVPNLRQAPMTGGTNTTKRQAPTSGPAGDAASDVGGVIGGTSGAPV